MPVKWGPPRNHVDQEMIDKLVVRNALVPLQLTKTIFGGTCPFLRPAEFLRPLDREGPVPVLFLRMRWEVRQVPGEGARGAPAPEGQARAERGDLVRWVVFFVLVWCALAVAVMFLWVALVGRERDKYDDRREP